MAIQIEEVSDLRAAWPDIEPLIEGIMEYHRPWDKRTPVEGWTSRIYEFMNSKESITFLARDESGRALGFINGAMRSDSGIFREPFVFVNNAYVDEAARSQGVGSELMRRVEEWAHSAGAQEIRLHVSAGNELGFGFWSKFGFETSEYVMRKPLAEAPA